MHPRGSGLRLVIISLLAFAAGAELIGIWATNSVLRRVVEHSDENTRRRWEAVTDAAAAALHMLFRMAEQDQKQLEKELTALKRLRESDRKKLDSMQSQLSETAEKTSKAIEDAEAARKLAAARPAPVSSKAVARKAPAKKIPSKRLSRRKRR